MIIIKNKLIPFGSYETINLFGILFTKGDVDRIELNHERIHSVQMIELTIVAAALIGIILIITGGSVWWLFAALPTYYLWYVFEYMWISVMHDAQKCAYHDISFEEEAYANQDNLDYIKHRKPFSWTTYLKMESNHKDDRNCCN